VWPYLGPSTQRDAVGSVVDMAANPLGWLIGTQVALAATQMAVTAGTTVDAVDRLGQLKTAEDASLDFYSFVRSSYYQIRRAELREAIGSPASSSHRRPVTLMMAMTARLALVSRWRSPADEMPAGSLAFHRCWRRQARRA
jgi:ABC-type transporter lipoprotein component MlaA